MAIGFFIKAAPSIKSGLVGTVIEESSLGLLLGVKFKLPCKVPASNLTDNPNTAAALCVNADKLIPVSLGKSFLLPIFSNTFLSSYF